MPKTSTPAEQFETWMKSNGSYVGAMGDPFELKQLRDIWLAAWPLAHRQGQREAWEEAATVVMNFPCVGGATDNVFMTICNIRDEFRRRSRAQGGQHD